MSTLRRSTILLLAVMGSSAAAQFFTAIPSADAFLSAAAPNSNYGGGGALAVAASGLPKGEFESLLKFDLAPAKASFDALYGAGLWSVQSITLTLTASAPNNVIFNGNGAGLGGTNVNFAGQFSLSWLQDDSWVEGSGTPQAPGGTGVKFADLATIVGAGSEGLGTFSFGGSTTSSTAYALGLTPSFSSDVLTGSTVSFLAAPADAGVAMLVNSRTGSVFARPALTVVAVPEPGSAALALAGLALLGGRRRRS